MGEEWWGWGLGQDNIKDVIKPGVTEVQLLWFYSAHED